MGKRIFWIFIALMASIVAGAVLYIQSEKFANFAKERVQKIAAKEAGLDVNFDRLKIGILPPSVSLVNVSVKALRENNALGISLNSKLKSEKIGITFRMIQAFSRGISVNKVFISDADIELGIKINKSKNSTSDKLSELVHRPIRFEIGEKFFANIRQVEIKNTKLDLSLIESDSVKKIKVNQIVYLALTPGVDGTNIVANLSELDINVDNIKQYFKAVQVNADIERNKILLSSLDLQRREAAVHASGKILGIIDKIEEAKPDVDFILRSPFKELSDFEKSLSSFDGEILADMKVVGKIKDPAVQGRLEVNNFKTGMWALDKLDIKGSFGGGTIVFDSISATKGEGNISLKSELELPIPIKAESKAFQLKFHSVKLEEFAGELKKDINNLKMVIDGTIGLKIDLASEKGKVKLAGISARPQLNIKDFELNNQVYGKNRPYKNIFKLRPLRADLQVNWKGSQVQISDGKLEFETGAVSVRGDVSSTNGYNLQGHSDKINLGKEVGQIGGNQLLGEGSADVHVHGPGNAVIIDFDVKQKDAKFADFDFGEIDGRVTYDDKSSYIQISNLKGKKNNSAYTADGKVNVGDGNDLSVTAQFKENDPNDLFLIFAKQLEKLTWLPRGMLGTVSGQATVGGTYDKGLDSLEIRAAIKGKNLAYKGEVVQDVEVNAGVRKGVIFAENLKAQKYDTRLTGSIEYFPNDELKYQLSADKGKLRSLDFITGAGLPIDGILRFTSEGKGKWETLESKTKIEIRNGFVRTKAVPPLDINFDTFADRTKFELELASQKIFSTTMMRNAKDDSHAEINLNDNDFAFLLCLVNRKSCTDPSLQLQARAEGKFNWKSDAWKTMSGQATVSDFRIAKSGFSLKNASTIKVKGAAGFLEADKFFLEGEDSKLAVGLKGKVDGSSLKNELDGTLSLKFLEFLNPLIEEGHGKLDIHAQLLGDFYDGNFQGLISMKEGFLRLNGLDAPVESLNGKINLNGSRLTVESMNGLLGGGQVQVSGGMDLYINKPPRFALDLFLTNNRLKFFPINYAEFSEAKLNFTGSAPPYLFGGLAKVKRVMMRNNFDMAGNQKALQNARYLPEKVSGAKSFYEIRIRAIAEDGVIVQNDLLDAEFKGELTLLNNFDYPQVIARAELVKGKLLFKSTPIILDRATIRLPNPEVLNPQFSIGGTANVDIYKIDFFASGSVEKPKITLSSTPALPQEDIISLLAFGFKGQDAKNINPNDSSAITYSEVSSILLEQLRLSKDLQSKGVRVTVVPALDDSESRVIRPNAPGTASPKVYLQAQIMKNLEATLGSTVGATQGQSADASLEYTLSQKASGQKTSLSAVYEQKPGIEVNEKTNSYGTDLKFRWGFK